MTLTIEESAGPAETVLVVDGDVDLSNADLLTDRVAAVLDRTPGAVVVDLSAVSFFDSAGLRALFVAFEAAGQRGVELRLARPTERILELLRVTRLDRYLKVD